MGIVYYKNDVEVTSVVWNMQGVAIDQFLWDAYMSFGMKGRAIFKDCLGDQYEWQLSTVLAWAGEVENPQPPVQRKPASAPRTTALPRPPRGIQIPKEANRDEAKFLEWMLNHTNLVAQRKDLSYCYGPKRTLKDGTIAVAVAIAQGGKVLNRTGFVFHYHRGAAGARVGATEASKWHFKPNDGTSVRLKDHHFEKFDSAMLKRVKDIARAKR